MGADAAFLPFSRPSITDAERDAVNAVLDSGWLTTGPRAKEFEAAFAAKVGARHAVAISSATAALHLALEALGVGPGDEVIVPTWTFTSTAAVVLHRGAIPVIVDVERTSLNATPDAFEAAIGPRTRAAIAVHFAGAPAFIGELVDRLGRRGIAVVEDSAHAFPSRIASADGGQERYAGTIGAIGAYSFYATKTITTGEGGMLVTDDDAIAERARLMGLHGMSRDSWKRYTSTGSWRYDVVAPGYKYNMPDIAAALGLAQLARADELFDERRRLVGTYRSLLTESGATEAIELPHDSGDGSHAWHLFVIRLRDGALRIGRDEVIEALRERGIGTSVHFIPLHFHTAYRSLPGVEQDRYPVANAEAARVISLPLWPGMGTQGVERVAAALGEIIDANRT